MHDATRWALWAASTLLLAACKGGSGDTGADACPQEPGTICAWAGTGDAAFDGDGNHRLDSMFYFPMGLTFSPYGRPVIADWNNHRIRMLQEDDTFVTIMGTDFLGDGPPDMSDLAPPGAPGTTVNLNHPTDQVYLPDGTLWSASWHTHKLRSWDPETGNVLVELGSTPGFAGDDWEPAEEAQLNQPRDILVTRDGNILFVDMRNERIRELRSDGAICTIVGSGEEGSCGDGGPGREACLDFPRSENPLPGGAIALSADERLLYIADTESHRIRVYDREADVIETLAGTGEPGLSGDGGPATEARLNFPRDVHLLDEDTLLVADTMNNAIRVIDLAGGTIDTFAGTGEQGSSGDGGPATEATFNLPYHVTSDLDGHVYVSDTHNHRVRVIYR